MAVTHPELDIRDDLERAYERFIEFGGLLNRRMRQYLVRYLREKFEPDGREFPELNDQYFRFFQRALDDLLDNEELRKLTESNARIRRQVIIDLLHWLRRAHDRTKAKHPYQDEVDALERWAITPLHVFVQRWTTLTTYLANQYAPHELDFRFFRDRFQNLIAGRKVDAIDPGNRERIEALLKDLLAQWDARIYAKILDFELNKLGEEQAAFAELLEQKVSEFMRLQSMVAPFSEYLGWDLSRQLWKDTSFDIMQRYADLLEDEQSIKELADLLGRMREAEIELEEETFERSIIRREWQVDEWSRAEIVGVHESDELTNITTGEIGLLSNEDTEGLFLKKFVDKQLLTFKYEERRLVTSEDQEIEVNRRVRQKEKGPFIICIDTSQSMMGRPEQIAKVLCLGVLKMAIRDNRRAYLINFSRGISTLDLYEVSNSVDAIADFLRMSFHGGTDASPALSEAIRQLGDNDYADADVLMVSDFVMYKIDDDVLRKIRNAQQNRGTRFHSLALSREANAKILEFFDTNWQYDPKQKGIIRSLTRGMRDLVGG